jgi:acyl-CoA reductase-like NAD-dependent aldehyde dehydrogenase
VNDIVCISPVDGSEVARRRIATDGEIAQSLAAARQAQREWSRVPLAERKAKALAFLEVLRVQNREIVPELAIQMGRPVRYGGELRSLEERVRVLVELSDEALAPTTPAERPGFRRMIKRVPAGIVLVIAPWNYPYLTAVNAVVPALLAGNAVILKHAAQTLLVGERFQSAMDQAGLPKHLFTTLNLDHGAAEKLIASRSVDHVNFTGSVAGGRAIERAAAGTFTTLGLELGGKDPAYVRSDADFDFAVEQLVDGAFYNSGQCCCGIERIYVHEQVYDHCDYVDPSLAWTGIKDTGRGASMSRLGFEALTRPKSFHLRIEH